jgi:hypothetical protein
MRTYETGTRLVKWSAFTKYTPIFTRVLKDNKRVREEEVMLLFLSVCDLISAPKLQDSSCRALSVIRLIRVSKKPYFYVFRRLLAIIRWHNQHSKSRVGKQRPAESFFVWPIYI